MQTPPRVLGQRIDMVARQPLTDRTARKRRVQYSGVVGATKPCQAAAPQAPVGVDMQRTRHAGLESGTWAEELEAAVAVAGQPSIARRNPEVPGAVLAKCVDPRAGRPSVRRRDVLEALMAALPAVEARVQVVDRADPDVTAKILEDAKHDVA